MLTHQQKRCLDYIAGHIQATGGVSPSFHEIMVAMSLNSTNGVDRLVRALVERGHLRRIPKRPRALEVVDNGRKRVAKPTVHYENALYFTWDYNETDPKKQMKPWHPKPVKPRE